MRNALSPAVAIRHFTLVEVVIAVGILAIALGALLAVVAQAKADMGRALDARARQHSLQNATEWYLLADPDELELPDGLLPNGYQSQCEILEVMEELPEHAQQPMDGWELVLYRISVWDDQGQELGVNEVYRMVREEGP